MTGPALDPAAVQRLVRIGGQDLLKQMVGLYLENGPHRLRTLEDGIACGNAGQVERAAHTLKSSAGNVGAVRLQRLAESVEAAAAAGVLDDVDTEHIRRAYDESAAALQRVLEEHDE